MCNRGHLSYRSNAIVTGEAAENIDAEAFGAC